MAPLLLRRPAPAEDHPELRVIGVPVHAEKRDVAAHQEAAVEPDVEAASETPIDAPVHVDAARAVVVIDVAAGTVELIPGPQGCQPASDVRAQTPLHLPGLVHAEVDLRDGAGHVD